MALKIQTRAKFSKEIESMVSKNEGLTYMDALMIYLEKHQLEPEKVAKLMSPNLKDKFYKECAKLHLLKGVDYNPLPFLEDD